jgi:serine protease inhibitor
LEETYQKNEISMDEDGTTAKSVTFSLGGGAAAPVEEDNTYVVDLDSPFLFYIKDASGIPLFMGYVAEV